MKLNKKGFTLIELLAVIVLLLAISVIAVPNISSAIERNKVKYNDAKIEIIVDQAELYYEEHKNSLESSGCISLDNLDLSSEDIEDVDGEKFTGSIKYTDGSDFEYVDNCP